MKKLLISLVVFWSCFPAFAQKEFGKALETVVKIDEQLVRVTTEQMLKVAPQVRLLETLGQQQVIPLQIAEVSRALQTKLAVSLESMQGREIATGKLLRSTYMRYQEADLALNDYLERINQAGNTSFLYRGMHVNDLQDVQQILAQGMLINQTGYNSIYMSSNFAVARHYAKLEEGIPVVIAMKKESIAGFIRPTHLTNYYAEKDIPAESISEVFVLLDINGKPGWYRVVLQDELVFLPLVQQVAAAETQLPHIKITNLPGQPLVKLGGNVDNSSAILSARMLPGADSWNIIRPVDVTGEYTHEVFLPQNISGNEPSFYRSMSLVRLDDVKNLLINGLEIRKSNYEGKIFVVRNPVTSLWYATMNNDPQFPILIKIPSTSTLRLYAPEVYPPQTLQTTEETAFRRTVPARLISDVWIFLAVDGKPDWYKVVLEKDELVFIPAKGEMKKLGD